MALSDPQSIKIGETETSLPRVSTGDFESSYLSADGTVQLKLSTQNGNRKRQVIRVDWKKITEDPFDTTQNVEVSMSCYVVFDRPLTGFSNDDAKALYDALAVRLAASSGQITKQLLASES